MSLMLGSCSKLSEDRGIAVLDTARMLETEERRYFNGIGGQDWPEISLPDAWVHGNQYADQWHRYYQLELPVEAGDFQRPAIFVPRVAHNLRLYLNGVLIWQPGKSGPELSRFWNTPQLIPIPVSALQRQDNLLLINVQSNYSGFLSQLYVGEYEALFSKYRLRLFWQQSLNESLFAIVLAVGIFTGLLWYFRRSQGLYLYCSMASLSWAFYMYGLIAVDPAIPNRLFWTLLHGSVDTWVFFITLFCLRFRHRILPRFELAYALVLVGVVSLYAVLPPMWFLIFSSLVHLVSLGICLWSAVGQWNVKAEKDGVQHQILGGALVIFVLLSLYDSWLHSPLGAKYGSEFFDLSATSAPLVMLLIAWNLAVRFTRGMKEAGYLRHNLENEIKREKEKLEAEFEEEARDRAKSRAFHERRAIYRALHDELSEKLLALLHTAQTSQQADTARSAISELRDATLSASTVAEKLDAVLADCRSEAQQRCTEYGLPMEWDQLGAMELYSLDSSVNSCVRRTIRESLNNIFKYAQATQVQMNFRIEYDGQATAMESGVNRTRLVMSIVDNGVGVDEQRTFEPVSLKSRIDAVGGVLSVRSAQCEGTQIQIRLPVISEPAEQGRGL